MKRVKNFLGIVDKKNPIIRRYYREKETAKFYIANKNIFKSYINLQPKKQYPSSSIITGKNSELPLRNEKMKINTITTNINQNRINFSSETNNSTNSLAVNSSENDTFSSNNKLSKNTKFGLGIGLVAIASTLIYYLTRRTPKGNIKTNTSMPIPSKPAHTPQGSLPHTPKDEHIVFNKNGNPQQILGCDEETAQHLKLEFLEAVKKSKSQKAWEDMSPQESTEWHNWYGEIYHKLHEQIKEYNISTVEKKVFSDDPLQQIEEKHKYIEDVIFRMQDNEASYYDGLLMFEKYGTREPFSTYGISTLSEIATSMPDNPTPKTVNKFMDIFEKFGIFTDSGSGSVDGQNYLNTLAKEGILTSEEQVVRAFEKGKNIIWCNDSIDDIAYTLIRAENAPFKNNSTVKNVIKQAYQTAFDNRTPLKDDFNIKSYERSWGITRE